MMISRRQYSAAALVVAAAVALSACTDLPTSSDVGAPSLKKGGGGGGGTSLSVSMAGDFAGDEQVMSGKNDGQTLSVSGDYTLTLALDLATLECADLPGSIPDEAGLVEYVQSQSPRVGALSITYDKTAPDVGQVDNWTTSIDGYKYRVQFFRWGSKDFTDGVDGTVVNYRGGSIEVFKMKKGRYISREQCFGDFVDYDLTVR